MDSRRQPSARASRRIIQRSPKAASPDSITPLGADFGGQKSLQPALVGTLNQMFNAAVKQLDTEQRLAQLDIEPVNEAPQQFTD